MPPSDGDADLDATGPTMTPSAAAHLPRPSPRGALSLEHYRYESVLGRGGMGEIVLADDLRIGRKVAIKRMRHVASADDDAAARFLREATIQARLEHPAIVPVHEVGRDADGQPYFTMKRLAGTTLADSLARGDRSLREMLRAFIEVCHAIDFAHARGVVHRDLKPANIMLGDYNEVYVLDWGVARVEGDPTTEAPLSAPVSGESTTTEVGAVLGTPMYMAPEQGRGDAVTPAADVFALGAVLFEVLAATQLRTKLGVDPDPSPARRAPSRDVPPELDAACIAALAPEPDARPTARDLARRVQTYLDGDRDLELRRTQSARYLADALAAESTRRPERRADAMRLAGQALALDPSSVGAAQLVGRLMLEPPDELPTELAKVLADTERDLVTRQARLAVRVVVRARRTEEAREDALHAPTSARAGSASTLTRFTRRNAPGSGSRRTRVTARGSCRGIAVQRGSAWWARGRRHAHEGRDHARGWTTRPAADASDKQRKPMRGRRRSCRRVRARGRWRGA